MAPLYVLDKDSSMKAVQSLVAEAAQLIDEARKARGVQLEFFRSNFHLAPWPLKLRVRFLRAEVAFTFPDHIQREIDGGQGSIMEMLNFVADGIDVVATPATRRFLPSSMRPGTTICLSSQEARLSAMKESAELYEIFLGVSKPFPIDSRLAKSISKPDWRQQSEEIAEFKSTLSEKQQGMESNDPRIKLLYKRWRHGREARIVPRLRKMLR